MNFCFGLLTSGWDNSHSFVPQYKIDHDGVDHHTVRAQHRRQTLLFSVLLNVCASRCFVAEDGFDRLHVSCFLAKER